MIKNKYYVHEFIIKEKEVDDDIIITCDWEIKKNELIPVFKYINDGLMYLNEKDFRIEIIYEDVLINGVSYERMPKEHFDAILGSGHVYISTFSVDREILVIDTFTTIIINHIGNYVMDAYYDYD